MLLFCSTRPAGLRQGRNSRGCLGGFTVFAAVLGATGGFVAIMARELLFLDQAQLRIAHHNPMLLSKLDKSLNILEVKHHQGVSRLVNCRTFAPLKVFNPRVSASTCALYLSHFGGGMVDGDDVHLKIRCRRDSSVSIGSFGNLQVYASATGGSFQVIEGEVLDGALVVVLPDPVVLHAGSRFRQRQEWNLTRGSSLLVAECMVAGRLHAGERFAFDTYDHEFSVLVDGTPLLFDRFVCRPAEQDFSDPALLGGGACVLTVYMVGPRWEPLKRFVESEGFYNGKADHNGLLLSMHPVQEHGYVIRAVANDGAGVRAVMESLRRSLAQDSYLGFDPGARKY
ncbi:MAG: urease accessory protein UreD [Thermodesulfobacteriota bacterium]